MPVILNRLAVLKRVQTHLKNYQWVSGYSWFKQQLRKTNFGQITQDLVHLGEDRRLSWLLAGPHSYSQHDSQWGSGWHSENAAKHTHTVTEQSSQKQHTNTAETHAHINHTLAHTHACFRRLIIAIHPVSLLLSSPLFALLTVGHDLQRDSGANEKK